MNTCDWCGKVLNGWFYRYKDKTFCQDNHDKCIKEFLFYEHDNEISEDRSEESEYDMKEILDNECKGIH